LKKSKWREDEKTQNFISIAFLFTLTYAQHQHGSTLQSTERVKGIVFGILLAKNLFADEKRLAALEEAKFALAFSSIRGVRRFLGSLRIFALAESLGGAESLIKHPATMTHAYLSKDERGKSVLKIH
jgi:cystathionine beta-lyase/cystathionine gamma-synthase